MKKAYRPAQKRTSPDVVRLGALLAIAAGVMVLAVASFLLWRSTTPASSAANAAPEVTGGSRLRADKQKVDLGNVKLGQTVQVSFELTNVGDQPLRFLKDPFVEVVEGC